MKKTKSLYHGHRFPAAIISCAVRWYYRFNLSLRDIEELLFERGVVVSYETIRRWCGNPSRQGCPAQAGQHLAPGRDVRDAARRALPAVARGRRTWRRTRYPAAEAPRHGGRQTVPELANVKHMFVKASARVNNRAENSHQPTRERERRMRGFRDPKRTQAFLSSFGPIRQHFALKRHLLRASLYPKHLADRFETWREFTGTTQNPSAAA